MTTQKPAKERFEAFHRDNPSVYTELVKLALVVKRSGRRKFGIRPIWERVRWSMMFDTQDTNSEFKLNDHYKEYYSRLMMASEPELQGFFTVRRSRADYSPTIVTPLLGRGFDIHQEAA